LTTHEPDVVRRGNAAAAGLNAYFRDLVRARRLAPGDDLLSGLIAAHDGADRLSEDELLATCTLLFFAGHETTVNLIGNGMLALLRHPRELERLLDDPRLVGNAVEELLRFDSHSSAGTPVEEDVRIGGKLVHRGQRIMLLLGAANRDPLRFVRQSTRRWPHRRQPSRQLRWGHHYCVGAPLARLEAHIAIASLLRGLPRCVWPRRRHAGTFLLRGLTRLRSFAVD
jgi:cytochrome P450